ncbi:MoaD/ThiS family protein [Telmatospirillum sp. J64-1]|uniref:sulfur carrier protein ThiS n=1 Tax=Telmatospirillum sp. J64-1 TaxID=2502183 RepID=UPI00115E096C|nr:MoaD/ThiS family protein [Telmatospirillum sp. J64-1]
MAQATLKLYSVLAKFLPPEAHQNKMAIEVDETTTVGSIIRTMNLPAKSCHLVLLNGIFVHPEARAETPVKEGDSLAIWPPVAGG